MRVSAPLERAAALPVISRDQLGGIDPAGLSKTLDDTETAYVKRRADADASERLLERLDFERTYRAALARNTMDSADEQLLSALRGDN